MSRPQDGRKRLDASLRHFATTVESKRTDRERQQQIPRPPARAKTHMNAFPSWCRRISKLDAAACTVAMKGERSVSRSVLVSSSVCAPAVTDPSA